MGERSGGEDVGPGSGHGSRARRGRAGGSRASGARGGAAGWTEVAPAVVELALDLLPFPAFVVGPGGEIVHANDAGRSLREREPRRVSAELERAVAGDGDHGFDLVPVRAPAASPHWIAVRRREVTLSADRVCAAARRWRLTRRQAEVLAEVARGRSNREIAGTLGCAESTVELHVTAVLEKSRCQGRAELVARFWSEV